MDKVMTQSVATHFAEKAEFDPFLILSLVLMLVKMWMDCGKTEEEALDMVHNTKTWMGRKFKEKIRKHMLENGYDTGDIDQVYAAFKANRKSVTLDQIKGLYAENPRGDSPVEA